MSKPLLYTNCILSSDIALSMVVDFKNAIEKLMRPYACCMFDLRVSSDTTDDQHIQVIDLRFLDTSVPHTPILAMSAEEIRSLPRQTLVRINQNPYDENLWHLHVREDLVECFNRETFVLPSKEELAEKLAKD